MATQIRPDHASVRVSSHRRPTDDELETLMMVLTSSSSAMLLPVVFNGEQRYALGVSAPDGGVYVLAICPTQLDQVVNVAGERPQLQMPPHAVDVPAQRRQPGRPGL